MLKNAGAKDSDAKVPKVTNSVDSNPAELH